MAKTIQEQITALEERIKNDTQKLGELKASVAAAAALASLKQGDVIQYNYGRGETRGAFTGEVRAVIDTDKGKMIRVIKGSGAEEEIVTIRAGDIVAIGEEVQEADAPRSPADPLPGIE